MTPAANHARAAFRRGVERLLPQTREDRLMQRSIDTLLDSQGFWLIARLLLAVIFVSSGLAEALT